MKNPLNPLNQDKIIIDGLGLEILSVKPLNPLNRDPLNRDSLCKYFIRCRSSIIITCL